MKVPFKSKRMLQVKPSIQTGFPKKTTEDKPLPAYMSQENLYAMGITLPEAPKRRPPVEPGQTDHVKENIMAVTNMQPVTKRPQTTTGTLEYKSFGKVPDYLKTR